MNRHILLIALTVAAATPSPARVLRVRHHQPRQRSNELPVEEHRLGADLEVHPHRALTIAGGLWQLDERTGTGADPRYPSLEHMFDGSAVPAFGTDTTFRRASAGAVLDLRDNPLHPHSGSQYEVRVARYRDRSARTFDFDRVELDMQHYVPLPNRYRTLALRAAGVFTDPNRGDQIPFYYQPTLAAVRRCAAFASSASAI